MIGAGLGDLNVAQHGVGGRDAARRRIGQDDDIGQARLAQPLHRDRRARHLHEREHAFLHARPAGRREDDEGRALLERERRGGNDRLACRHAERAAHELEVLHGHRDGNVVQAPDGDRHGVRAVRLDAIFLQLVDVALDVAELERIGRHFRGRRLFISAIVEEALQPDLDRTAHVEAGARNDVEIGLDVLVIDELAALRTFHPKVFGRLALEDRFDLRRHDIRIPVHDAFLPKNRRSQPGPSPLPPFRAARAMGGAGERRDQLRDRGDALRRRPVFGVERVFQRADERCADDDAVRRARHGLCAFRRLHAEAHRDGQIGMALDARHGRLDSGVVGEGRPGNPGQRNIIDEAARVFEDLRQALVVRRRRREADEVQPRGAGGQAELVVLLGRQIDDDEPVDARLLRGREEALDAKDVDRIVIAHQHDRRRFVGGAEAFDELEGLLERRPALERAQARRLNGRPVRHGIGEGHAHLDHIGAGRGQAFEDLQRGLEVGIARHDESHEPRPPVGFQLREALVDPRRHAAMSSLGRSRCLVAAARRVQVFCSISRGQSKTPPRNPAGLCFLQSSAGLGDLTPAGHAPGRRGRRREARPCRSRRRRGPDRARRRPSPYQKNCRWR